VKRIEEGIGEENTEVEVVGGVIEGGIGVEAGWIIGLRRGMNGAVALGGTGIGGMNQEESRDLRGVQVDIRSRVDTG
jgi:hypothetical protein